MNSRSLTAVDQTYVTDIYWYANPDDCEVDHFEQRRAAGDGLAGTHEDFLDHTIPRSGNGDCDVTRDRRFVVTVKPFARRLQIVFGEVIYFAREFDGLLAARALAQ